MTGALCICYHGTKKVAARSIMKEGFREGTYFARHLEDAVGFGGYHVFEVCFQADLLHDNWQFCAWEVVPPDRIISYRVYRRTVEYENGDLRNTIFESNSDAVVAGRLAE